MSMSFKASPDGTYGEILVNGQVVAKLPVTGNAVLPGLVGTVSESGGIPTGAVVERGSNANGEYVRFADGTQICFRRFDSWGPITTTAYGGTYHSAGTGPVWTFPASFLSTPFATFNGRGWILTKSVMPTPSNARLQAWSTTAFTDATENLEGYAFGRWY